MTHRALLTSLSLALAASACDLGLPPGDITSPQYWGDAFLDKYADELVASEAEVDTEPAPEPLAEPRVVLLITGVTIPAEWFQPIEARLTRDGFIPVVYEPPDLLSGDLFANAVWLGEVIEQVRAEYGEAKIDILAECTGGLIARYYIQSLGGAARVSRLVTFISPQHGVDKAPWAESIVGWPALAGLTPGSDFLRAVDDAPLPEDVPITSIYSCTDEYIQPYETSIIPGATNIGLCDGFVGHFQFFYDPSIYLVMHTALTRPLAQSPEGPSAPDEPDPGGSDDAGSDDGGGSGDGDAPDDADHGSHDDDGNDDEGAGADDADAAGCSVHPEPARGAGWLFALAGGWMVGRRRRSRTRR